MIERHLGSGGFGCTYEASYRIMGCNVAIKEFFVKDFCNRGADGTVSVATQGKVELVEKLRKKFFDEARTLFNSKMHHPNIVRVTDIFEENGTVYYVMDYINGSPLSALIDRKGRLSEDEALGYICQVADALKHLHSNNCLHLDVKPQNIMVDGDGKAVLIDFGVSKQYDEASGENTSTLMGHTPGYAPIEQVGRSMVKFNAACDIYALGATLYKALTGQTPVEATLRAGGLGELDFPEYVSGNMRRAIDKAMKISRADRPQSIEEFLLELKGEGIEVKAKNGNVKGEQGTPLSQRAEELSRTEINEFEEPSSNSSSTPGGEEEIPEIESGETHLPDDNTVYNDSSESDPLSVQQDDKETEGKENKGSGPKLLWMIIALLPLIIGVIFMSKEIFMSKKDADTVAVNGTINGHDYVDLGLPSGLKWATCNVGASSPEQPGDYYAWAETTTKSDYSLDNYKYHNANGYINIGNDISGTEYDVAKTKWGESWRLPTEEEFQELIDNCDWEWTTQNGENGYKVTGPNGNSIFLPAAGYRYGAGLNYRDSRGNYWSGSLSEYYSSHAYYLDFNSRAHGVTDSYHEFGHTVRPVLE